MAQAPEDAPVQDNAAANTTTTTTTEPKKKRFSLEDVSKGLKGIGNKIQEFGQKAAASTAKFVAETEEDIKNTKSMTGLLTMATNEFQTYIKRRNDTTDKVDVLKSIADSFKDADGICFVASFNVAFTVGGSYGRGIVMKRLSDGNWSLPLAIQEIEGNVGWQLNVSRSKTFYVLRNDQAIKNFQQKGNVKLGGKGFAAIGNLGVQAQGNVKASKESLTTTTNDANDVAATNASMGSVKGLALGANVNLGTFQPCKKINEETYENFDILKLFERGTNVPESEMNVGGGDHYDAKEENTNKIKSDSVVELTKELVKLMESIIKMDKAEAEVEAKAKAMRAQQAKQENDASTASGSN